MSKLSNVQGAAETVREAEAARDATLVEAYTAGFTLNQISNVAGINSSLVRQILINHGVEMRKRGTRTTPVDDGDQGAKVTVDIETRGSDDDGNVIGVAIDDDTTATAEAA